MPHLFIYSASTRVSAFEASDDYTFLLKFQAHRPPLLPLLRRRATANHTFS